ncbi:enoyl-CoA hydratase/isomerase family protein [Pseudonocardia sp. ICBG1293]|uniref:enoyl-CoA hydratase/isomerase family protein n=1 Tax=Pseudonocardia sp. ICBG1293 TaxID=2844382 RepID=UPI001CD006D4|nr:enoyl-CoA hydratase-related protein [Pseudonocardia sp. ICBG1293]
MTTTGDAIPAPDDRPVLTDRPEPGILRITLKRPGALNAMSAELIEALHDELRAVQEDSGVRAIVLTGAGRAFCAGLDLRGYGDPPGSPAEEGRSQAGMRVQQHISSLGETFRRVRAPIIGAVNGAAVGGGMALAVFCDIRLMARSAILQASFIRRGLGGTDIGLSWLLPRMVGFARATDLILTGRTVDADEAERIGLVAAVVDDDALQEAALERARLIAGHSPFGVWMSKEVLWTNQETGSFQAAVELENRSQILTALTKDHREAVEAFLEKRPPVFRNR